MKANLEEMKNYLFLLVLAFTFPGYAENGFKIAQKRYANVRVAYEEKESLVAELLNTHQLFLNEIEIHVRIYKSEKQVELWMKNKQDSQFIKVKQFKICFSSGILGPKRRKHDLQVPEGFYELNSFNPSSYNFLSLGINYPNKSDRILGEQGNLGGSIAIHGGCVSVGCLPISDDLMKELYICAVEARNNGQKKIPIRIFPRYMTLENYNELKVDTLSEPDYGLWEDLKNEYDYFKRYRDVRNFRVLPNGRHQFVFE
ncbi:MAG: murein L,D-transpeptidase YafK [Crocinitomix sp.]|jgi:murein L,D-transpeptidase YafK